MNNWQYFKIDPGQWCDIDRDDTTPGTIFTIDHNFNITNFPANSSLEYNKLTGEVRNIIGTMEIMAESNMIYEIFMKILDKMKNYEYALNEAVRDQNVIQRYILERCSPDAFTNHPKMEYKYWGFGEWAFVIHTV